ncbi:MAG: UvrD-helicase domain-containing protein, partial [Planctomycetaceae bacterium]
MSGLPINERVLIRASAGTGKTYQLTNRYISRLLHDVPPSEMLAVTFTRNAAAEILDRVLVRLARAADDPDETRQLAEATGETDLEPGRCRQVLAGVIDSLQQLRISTLDSYFNRVASSFSLELELPVPWRMIDDIETGQLKREAIRRVVHRGDQTVLRQLVNLLSGSDATRSVEDTLLNVVTDLHRTFRETSRNEDSARAWKWLDRPKRPGRSEIDQAVAVMQNAALPEGSSWNKAHQKAIADVDAMAWEDLVKRGLGLKIVTGTVDESKVPPEVIAAYQHAFGVLRADVSNRLADQTAAIYDVLEMFDAEFTGLKHELRCVEFEDITQQLSVTALREDSQRLAHRLNADVDHLLLDEFQDTSPLQWQVISPLAREITGGNAQDRSFFCVGDRKQAIYGWRGGVAEILEELESELDGLTGKGQDLSESFRSTPEVILTINEVFGNRTRHDNLDQITDAVAGWTFAPHEAHHTNRVGYACLKTLPGERSKVDDEAKFDEIAAIIEASADYDVGILVRKNETVSEVVAQLRQREIPASQEGGFPLTDSAPVLTLLSMTRLADHPGDSIAGFHVASSPLGEILGLDRSATETDFSEVSRRLREDLIDRGYGAVIGDYARQLAEVSDEDERFRLSQLVRLASRYDARSTLRPAAFDRFIRSEGDGNPSADRVRVMNIHQAKG